MIEIRFKSSDGMVHNTVADAVSNELAADLKSRIGDRPFTVEDVITRRAQINARYTAIHDDLIARIKTAAGIP